MKHLMIILEGFKAIHAHWPEPVRLEQGYIDQFRTMLIDNSYRSLAEKVELVHDQILEMHTEESRAASFACGCDPILNRIAVPIPSNGLTPFHINMIWMIDLETSLVESFSVK